MLAAAANEIGAGHLDHRVEAETRDEFGSLIEAFNRMASDLSASRRRLEHSSVELERKHQDVEARRRYVETILERIATGVISVDTAGHVRTFNAAASRLLGLDSSVSGLPVTNVFGTPELKPLAMRDRRGGSKPRARAAPGGVDHARRPRAPSGGDDDAAPARGRRLRRHRPRVRRRHAAHQGAEGGGVARSGPPAGTRDQESPDADSAERRTDAAPLLERTGADPGARPGVHDHDCRRGRVAEGPGRRVLAVCTHAGSARGADGPPRPAHRRADVVSGHPVGGGVASLLRRRVAPCVSRSRTDPGVS